MAIIKADENFIFFKPKDNDGLIAIDCELRHFSGEVELIGYGQRVFQKMT